MGVSSSVLILLCCIGAFYSIAVLFGAHPIKQFWGNLAWGVLMSLLTCVPSLITVGSSRRHLSRVFIQGRFSRASEIGVYFGCIAALLGAWVGAFPILLDWRRPWQVWPIPCSIAAVALWTCYWIAYLTVQTFWPHLLLITRTPL
ncbi:phosphatidylinositol-glycan biosynthesis class F protein-like [Halichondria panicea]|uniref:phosphatidylinositol-glycan biosynthesis class F protein-like n=1 Tax=Halichondria panicea TaxID=6063 RepID=UPI00312B700B